MSKTFKIIIILLIMIFAINTITSNAASINMNLEAENAVTDENTEEATNSTDTNTISNTTSNTTSTGSDSSSDSANVTKLSSLPESELGLANIINILLIAVGVILIFLAIAILIRLAHK